MSVVPAASFAARTSASGRAARAYARLLLNASLRALFGAAPWKSGTATDALARRAAAALKFHRLVGGVEASLVILAAGIADAVVGGLGVSRVAVVVLAAIAVLQTLLHLVSILASSRLR